MQQCVVEVEGLRKSYGPVVAVDGISFTVARGEVFGIAGPNGSGKTTTVECTIGLRRPDAGRIRVLGLDPRAERKALQCRLGVQLQDAHLPDRLTVAEALDLFASFYPRSLPAASLAEQLGLAAVWRRPFGALSGGEKQRLFIALALLHDPEVVFLDELTTGLDPHARRAIWDRILALRDQGKTVVITTHLMDEAEQLCDRLAIVVGGRVVAEGTPGELVRRSAAPARIAFTTLDPCPLDALGALPGVDRVEARGSKVTVYGGDGIREAVVAALDARGVQYRDLRVEPPTLQDAYLLLARQTGTGRQTPCAY